MKRRLCEGLRVEYIFFTGKNYWEALIDQLARWSLGFFGGVGGGSNWLQLQTCHLTPHTICCKSLCEQAIAALRLLIAPIGPATSAVTDQEPSYAECLNNMTTWCPTQMVAVMLKRVVGWGWMIQHMYCTEHRNQEQGASDEYMLPTEINTVKINNNKHKMLLPVYMSSCGTMHGLVWSSSQAWLWFLLPCHSPPPRPPPIQKEARFIRC